MTAADHANTVLCGDCCNPIGCAKYGCRKPAAADHANTPRALAEKVRDAMDAGGDFRYEPVGIEGHAALDTLEAQAKAADITDNLINDLTSTAWHWKACVEAAEREAQDARLARTVGIGTMKQRARAAEADRDLWHAKAEDRLTYIEELKDERDRLAEALYNHGYGAWLCRCEWCAALARTETSQGG